MSRGFEAITRVTVDAPADFVWRALTDPAIVKEYLHGTRLTTDWKVGRAISWTGEWKGTRYEDRGTVLDFEPNRLLRYTHWSPLGGSDDRPENYHTVSFELVPVGTGTEVTLRQDNNATQDEADRMASDNWGPVLEGLKKSVETRTVGQPA